MFSRQIKLFKLFGFEVGIDLSWVLLALLITWTLAAGYFPARYPGLATDTYWWMAIVGALGLFFSIIFHELAHSLIARRYGLPISGITLFLFGGVAHMSEEPSGPKAEFMMAVAGPIASFLLAFVFYLLHSGTVAAGWAVVGAVLGYLAAINLILAIFNLVPAFPLDGGRMLRSALWGWKGNLRWASRIASNFGSAFGIALIILGAINFISGNFIGGMWWFLIGLFIKGAAGMSYRQTLVREALQGVPVRRVMHDHPVTVPPSLAVADLVEDYFYRHYHKMFPVVDGERLFGCVTLRSTSALPRERWPTATVGDIMNRCGEENTVRPDMDAIEALSRMQKSGNSRLLVAENDRLVGIVTLKDMLRFLSFKMELEEGEQASLFPASALSGGGGLSVEGRDMPRRPGGERR